jgi:hypothetical protein
MVGIGVDGVRRFAGHDVHVRLFDGSRFAGRLRTELLSEHSLSVFIAGAAGEGVTLYIDQIAEIVPIEPPTTP